jgi:hypothetical protein
MPHGKPAGVRCIQLTPDNRCRLYGHPDRPAVCVRLRPSQEMCGQSAEEAYAWLLELEWATRPIPDPGGLAPSRYSACNKLDSVGQLPEK